MAPLSTDRIWLALVGALAGAALWAVGEAFDQGLIGRPAAGVLTAFAACLGFAVLAMAGPIGLRPALGRAVGLAGAVAVLVGLGGLRFDIGLIGSDLSVLAALVVASLPVPFLITQALGTWRDYPELFLQAWSVVVRYATALAFTGLVWLVVWLSDQVLQIVGITAIAWAINQPLVALMLTGAILGLGLAVVQDHAALMSPHLLLRLFRMLLPVVLAVLAVFLVALPFRGLEGLFYDLSPTLTLLALLATGVSLVAIAIDQSDTDAALGPVQLRAAQAMALLLPVLAALAVWGLGLRVVQHGWTPERLFVALVAALGLAYGVVYALAVLRGAGWTGRIRRGNIRLALVALALAALWLTPILNAEAIAARSQLARYEAGKTPVADLDIAALQRWGRPGAAVLAALDARASDPAEAALAARLAQAASGATAPGPVPDAQTLAALIPVQPPGATATRAVLLAAAPGYQRSDWATHCAAPTQAGTPACLMIVADLLPHRPGEEAVLILAAAHGYHDMIGLFLDDRGGLATRAVTRVSGGYVSGDAVAALVEAWRSAPPPLAPAQLNQLGTGPEGLLILP